MKKTNKVLIIGLDCATPQFVFGPDAFELPNLRRLAESGAWGRLRSSDPPITVPAWSCMTSGKDAGQLGCYGFRNRKDHSYDNMSIATSLSVREKRIWDILSEHGREVILLGVPQTYPVSPVNGCMVSGLLTPDTQSEYTWPDLLKAEIEANVGEYIIDAAGFRNDDKDATLNSVYALMENRFNTARYLMSSKSWDFFMMVEMGVDRIHHAFWRYADSAHPDYVPNNPYENVIRDYYRAVDARIGDLLTLAGSETAVLVVSDHGAKAMHGGICINQWLINEGLLTIREEPDSPKRLEDCNIDWARTKAWASGGYYGRIFINVEGRESQGIVTKSEYETLRNELIAKLMAMPDHNGIPLGTKVFKPEELYKTINGTPPDLLVYFGDLNWRSVGKVGYDDIYIFENDTGPDDANHDYNGIFIMDDKSKRGGEELHNLNIMDVAPTVLRLLDIDIPEDIQGKAVEFT